MLNLSILSVCTGGVKEQCVDIPSDVCVDVPRDDCRDVQVVNCKDFPRQECGDVARDECTTQVPREVHNVVKERACGKVDIQICHPEVCKGGVKEACVDVPETTCVKIPTMDNFFLNFMIISAIFKFAK